MSKQFPAPKFKDLENKSNIPRPTFANTLAAIEAMHVACSYNEMTDQRIVAGAVLGSEIGQVTDDTCRLFRELSRTHFLFDPGKDNVWEAINLACRKNSFHPVRQYLDSLTWDGVHRLDKWMVRLFGAPDTPLIRHFSKMVLVASVRRIKQPGCKYDYMGVLEGPENKGKSLALATLYGQEYFSDQMTLGASDKEIQEQVRGRWCIEVAELAGMRKAEVERVKAQITRQVDRGRPAYGRAVLDIPRQCVLWGTTNDAEYLRSQTGNRRFIPVCVPDTIDIDGLRSRRDQLWAEAVIAEGEGFSIYLPDELWDEAKAAQASRTKQDPWIDILRDLASHAGDGNTSVHEVRENNRKGGAMEERVSSGWLLESLLMIPRDRQNSDLASRLRMCMEKLGWRYNEQAMRIGGTVTRGYVRELEPWEAD